MKSSAVLSTMWAIGRFDRLVDFFDAGAKLGFARFELNHGINSAMLAGLSLDGTIASVHEPCPADVSMRELKKRNWLISARDEEQRQLGVAAMVRSIDLAHDLGAGLVVVHPGQVDIDPQLEPTVHRLYREGRYGQPEYGEARSRMVAARAAQAEANMRSVRRSLLELAEHAAKKGVRLGLENRYHYPEIPLPDELEELLGLGLEGVGHWHDVGHAKILENQGLGTHEEWLRRFGKQIIGVHLHDVEGLTDHLAAGLGGIDWDLVARYLPAEALRTCEFQFSNSPEEVAAGLRWLGDKGIVTI
ncbi:MAG TPA: sugar phosphate isomerase/epimerase [Anaerolineae bacterium]|nr:sugar phosphate isomerase/epimerase [Anaerolineae bacterium]